MIERSSETVLRELILAAEAYRQIVASRLNLGLTESQAVSYLLARGPLGQSELATVLGLTSGSVTTLVDRLVKDGVVERMPHLTDRRRSIVKLSTHQDNLVTDTNKALSAALSVFSNEELPNVTTVLMRLTVGLREAAGEAGWNRSD